MPTAVSAATKGEAVNVEGIDEISQCQVFADKVNGDSLVYSIKSLKGNDTLKFTYDENCNRLIKTDGKSTTYYIYDENNKLVEEKSNKADIKFTITDENTTVGFEYEGKKYTYVFNSAKSKGWANAVWLACAVSTTQNRTTYAALTPKPKGIDKQSSFWKISYFASNMSASGGKIYVNNKALKNVAIAEVRVISQKQKLY